MARYCVAFDTMKVFGKVSGNENLSDLVGFLIKQHSTNVFDRLLLGCVHAIGNVNYLDAVYSMVQKIAF